PIVSSDIVGTSPSCTLDAGMTMAFGNQVKILGWYDNEWGYSSRLVDVAKLVGSGRYTAPARPPFACAVRHPFAPQWGDGAPPWARPGRGVQAQLDNAPAAGPGPNNRPPRRPACERSTTSTSPAHACSSGPT